MEWPFEVVFWKEGPTHSKKVVTAQAMALEQSSARGRFWCCQMARW